MKAFVTAKVGVFLVISSVLAVWMLLAAQPVQAHDSTVTLPTPTCSNLPSESGFLAGIDLAADSLTDTDGTDDATTQGGGVTGRGDSRFRYARITIPALAAGELRVFDQATAGPSDAVLCQGSSQLARSITSYSAHNTAHTAAATATRAAAAAGDDNDPTTTADAAGVAQAALTNDDTSATESARVSALRSPLSTARRALSTARSNLNAAVRALNAANATSSDITDATNEEQAALTAYNLKTGDTPVTIGGTAVSGTIPRAC